MGFLCIHYPEQNELKTLGHPCGRGDDEPIHSLFGESLYLNMEFQILRGQTNKK